MAVDAAGIVHALEIRLVRLVRRRVVAGGAPGDRGGEPDRVRVGGERWSEASEQEGCGEDDERDRVHVSLSWRSDATSEAIRRSSSDVYIESTRSRYRSSIRRRFTLRVGVTGSPS